MISTHQTSTPADASRQSCSGRRWLAAFGAAMAVQVAAAMAALGAVAIFLIAAFDDWANQQQEGLPAYVLLSIPLSIAAPGLFVASGAVATRISGDRRGWLMLLAGPLVWGLVRIMTLAA